MRYASSHEPEPTPVSELAFHLEVYPCPPSPRRCSGTYTADPVHSSFGFAVSYQGVSVFRGTLGDVEATLTDGRLEGRAKVESISIRTPEQFRAHVLSEEFFDAANHPEVSFVSDDVDLERGRHARRSPAT